MELIEQIFRISIAPYLSGDKQEVLVDGVRNPYKDVKIEDLIACMGRKNNKIINCNGGSRTLKEGFKTTK